MQLEVVAQRIVRGVVAGAVEKLDQARQEAKELQVPLDPEDGQACQRQRRPRDHPGDPAPPIARDQKSGCHQRGIELIVTGDSD